MNSKQVFFPKFDMSAYETAVRGTLSLKGRPLQSAGEKRRKKQKSKQTKEESEGVKRQRVKAEETEGEKKAPKETGEEESPEKEEEDAVELEGSNIDEDLCVLEEEQNPHWTPAEKAFFLAQKKREKERMNSRLKYTHRQRMEKLNAHLASLSEHFDQPRIGPG